MTSLLSTRIARALPTHFLRRDAVHFANRYGPDAGPQRWLLHCITAPIALYAHVFPMGREIHATGNPDSPLRSAAAGLNPVPAPARGSDPRSNAANIISQDTGN
jgi:hypothetical protein